MIAELRHRDPLLFWTGALFMLALLVVTLISISDTRQILGLNPWIKPMKFLVSTTIYLWTIAWFMPDTEPKPAARAIVRWTIAIAMVVEMFCVIMQSARGTQSHFNVRTPFDGIVFSIMGVMILFNTFAIMLFLWSVRRDTPHRRAGYLWGIRLGVAMFLVASFQGALIIGNGAHTVGAPDGGAGLPFVNWSTTNGDLRVAHFFGMHAMQALPLLGFLLDRSKIASARTLVLTTSILWLVITGGLTMMAMQGRPLLAL